MTIVRTCRLAGMAALALLVGGTLTACGSGGAASGTSTTAAPSATGGAGQQGGPGGMDGAQLATIQKCLTAAGISMPTPSGAPSGAPSGTPGGQGGQGTPPNGTPPTGAAGSGPGGGGMFSDAKVVAALKACGLTVPTGGPRPTATGSPSATSTS